MFALQNDAHCFRLAFGMAKIQWCSLSLSSNNERQVLIEPWANIHIQIRVLIYSSALHGLRFDNFNLQNTKIPPAIGAPKMVEFMKFIQSRLIYTCSRVSRPFEWILRQSSVASNATEFNKCGLWKMQRNRIHMRFAPLFGFSPGPYNNMHKRSLHCLRTYYALNF